MIRGVGIDISDPQRFEDMGEAMLRRIFTEHEIDSAPRRRGEHFAARFAAKEDTDDYGALSIRIQAMYTLG